MAIQYISHVEPMIAEGFQVGEGKMSIKGVKIDKFKKLQKDLIRF